MIILLGRNAHNLPHNTLDRPPLLLPPLNIRPRTPTQSPYLAQTILRRTLEQLHQLLPVDLDQSGGIGSQEALSQVGRHVGVDGGRLDPIVRSVRVGRMHIHGTHVRQGQLLESDARSRSGGAR